MFSPAKQSGLEEGSILVRDKLLKLRTILYLLNHKVQINGWEIEAMDNSEAAVGVVLAAGYCLTLGWLRPRHTHTLEEGWTPLYLCF